MSNHLIGIVTCVSLALLMVFIVFNYAAGCGEEHGVCIGFEELRMN